MNVPFGNFESVERLFPSNCPKCRLVGDNYYFVILYVAVCILTSTSEGQGRSKFISFFCICFATRIICGHMSTFTYCILFIE